VVIIGILVYFNQSNLKVVLIGSLSSLVSAVICWWLALRIKSNEIVSYFLGFILGFIGLLIYFGYYFLKKMSSKKDSHDKKKLKP